MAERTSRGSDRAKAAKRPVSASATSKRSGSTPPRRAAAQSNRHGSSATSPLMHTASRLWSALGVVAFVLSLFAARLIQLQGIDENDYAMMAAQKGAETITLEAPRAPIYDRTGKTLAYTVDAAKLIADPTLIRQPTKIAARLHARLGLDYIVTLQLLTAPDTRYVELARHLPQSRADALVSSLNAADLGGVFVQSDTLRVYPAKDVAANLIGFTGEDGTGLAGLEAAFEDKLAGTNGEATFEMANGQQLPLADSTLKKPVEGTGVQLTIDQDLQFLAQRRLGQAVEQAGGSSGIAVVQDVKTGELLALADYPTYDPNNWKVTGKEYYGSRALQDVYEPGSVEKVLTFASLIDAGYVTPRTKVTVPSTLPRGDATIHDYFDHGTLRLTAAGVIAKSSNIGTVLSAEQMPKQQMHDYLTSFGLGVPTGVELTGESAGLLPAADDWLPITRDTIAFGQGLSVNAVQMATAISAVANDGVYVEPSLVSGYVNSDGEVSAAEAPDRHRVVSARAASQVARMMEAVTGPDGTAPLASINGYRVAGKTGTAQRVDESCGCYDGSFTVSFAGFAPADDPRFAVYVVVQEPADGGGGGSTGGPVFHDLMAAALQKYGVPPTGQRSPAMPVEW